MSLPAVVQKDIWFCGSLYSPTIVGWVSSVMSSIRIQPHGQPPLGPPPNVPYTSSVFTSRLRPGTLSAVWLLGQTPVQGAGRVAAEVEGPHIGRLVGGVRRSLLSTIGVAGAGVVTMALVLSTRDCPASSAMYARIPSARMSMECTNRF